MTTRYAKVNFPLQLSSTSSYSDQLLPSDIDAETFTATKQIVDLDCTFNTPSVDPGDYILSYDLSSWTTADYAWVHNHADSAQPVYVVCFGEGTGPTDGDWHVVNPGKSIMIPDVPTNTGTLFSEPDVSFVVYAYDIADDPATFDVIILGT